MSGGLLVDRSAGAWTHSLWESLTEHEKATAGSADVQDAFSVNALRALSYEPMENNTLNASNWRKLDAALDVNVRLTGKGRLAMDVSPWPERYQRYPGGLVFEDFAHFERLDNGKHTPLETVFELELDELYTELRDPDMTVDPAATHKRRLVFHCYEHVLQRLARHFVVRVPTTLICLGAECRLLIRKTTLPDNPVEQALPAGTPDIRWHAEYLQLCEKASVAPEELLAFFKNTLLQQAEDERVTLLAEYLGTSDHARRRFRGYRGSADASTSRLLGALAVVASPESFPPLTGHPSEAVEKHLRRMVKSKPSYRDGVDVIAERYCLGDAHIRDMLRLHYPAVLVKAVSSPADLRIELEYFVKEHSHQSRVIEELWQRILEALGQEWTADSQSSPGVLKRRLAKICGLQGFDALQQWAQQYAPDMVPWLNSL